MTPGVPLDRTLQRSRAALVASALVTAFATALVVAPAALGISRSEVLARAQKRVDLPVPYSQQRYVEGYRTDCSGYVSYCWKTGTSWNTRSFYRVTHGIKTFELQPGDAMLKPGYHIRLFYAWLDDAHTTYVAYESASGKIAGVRIHSIAEDLAFGYKPVRYNSISGTVSSSNRLKNPGFDTWALSWGDNPETPVWWETNAEWDETLAWRRQNVYRTARNSLELVNASTDPFATSELRQTVQVTPGELYQFSAWAIPKGDPADVSVSLAYQDEYGQTIAEADSSGDRPWMISGTFRQLSVVLTAPPDAVTAVATVRLARGESASSAITGTSVVLDDLSLGAPKMGVVLKPNAGSLLRGQRLTLSGTVSPGTSIDTTATIYVQPSGGEWKLLCKVPIVSDGIGASYDKIIGSKGLGGSGVYRFKTVVDGVPGFLGATSNVVSVTVR